ncbi:hypothetical protein [Desulfosporosinus sp. SB140]|uniref:hypothetical protein n=1 Tax=Desulfosporosinus paludis TaxID=3115649 RepID=UPI00388F1138
MEKTAIPGITLLKMIASLFALIAVGGLQGVWLETHTPVGKYFSVKVYRTLQDVPIVKITSKILAIIKYLRILGRIESGGF